MLSAEKTSKALQEIGVKVQSYEESKDPKLMDGEVILENSLSVQVGTDYACLCHLKEDDIDYLLELDEVNNESQIATEVGKFLNAWQQQK
ncbi:MAG: hypothetical protein JRE63_11650 [Deltaproteobacteria bacterium]|jgi:hypothetical protein|nr:hypothetical protein [Deltaproteobacteria bacterium]